MNDPNKKTNDPSILHPEPNFPPDNFFCAISGKKTFANQAVI